MRWILFLLFASGFLSAKAQFIPGTGADKIEVTPNIAPVKTVLKVSLLSPLEVKNSIRLGVEITINRNLSIQPELGYIYNYSVGTIYKLQPDIFNFSQRLALRYYIPEKFLNGLYLSPMVDIESFNYQKGSWRNVYPANPDSVILDFSNPARFHENTYCLYVVAGIQPQLSRHFTLDLSGGLGFLSRFVTTQFDPQLINGSALPPRKTIYGLTGLLSLNAGYVF